MRTEHQDLLPPLFNSHILSSVPGRSQFTFAAANAVPDFETTVLYNDNVFCMVCYKRELNIKIFLFQNLGGA